MREHALKIFTEAVTAVQPHRLLPQYIQWVNNELTLGEQLFNRNQFEKLYVIGAGKASAAMARQAEIILGDIIEEGIIVTKYEHGFPLKKIRCIGAAHPVPDAMGIQAGDEIINLLNHAGENDIVLSLISGGASALLVDCPPGASLNEVQQVFTQLLKSGAAIREMNTIRKHLSPKIKGGQLARSAYPATIISFILSDVIGDPLESIASGPTVPDPSTFAEAWQVLEKYHLEKKLPVSIEQWLQKGLQGLIDETPKPGNAIFNKSYNYLAGTNRIAIEAAVTAAKQLNYQPFVLTGTLAGEASEKAVELVEQVKQYSGPRPACLLLGGETTVTIKNNGKGGRNQEFALAALTALVNSGITPAKMPVILSAGTDGTDGPTDAAGAIIDQQVIENYKKLQLSPETYLAQNDSYHFFEQAGGHVITGPTQTNVMDLVIVLIS